MANGDWRNDRDWRGRQDWRNDTNQPYGSRDEDNDRWREGRDDYRRGGEYGRSRDEWGSRRDYGGSGRDYGREFDRGSGRDFGRGAGGDQGFGRDYRSGSPQGGLSGNDYSRGNYGADQGYRQDYGRHLGDYEREGRGERGFWDRASDEVSSWFGDDDAERRRRMDEQRGGQHRGRGPKGYTRSDERIRDDVNDRLSDDPYVDASEIEVSVSSCEVTLSGTVDSRDAKRRAEDVVEQVSGVRHVQNNLRVQQQTSGTAVSAAATAGTVGAASSPRTTGAGASGPQGTGLGGVEVGPQGSESGSPAGRRKTEANT
jgi:osmotically-inducible protein OsmY